MFPRFATAILLSLFTATQVFSAESIPVTPARLIQSHWLDQSEGLDVSGLSYCDGKLLAVSDKTPRKIYAIEHDARGARFEPLMEFELEVPEVPWEGVVPELLNVVQDAPAADFEGISCVNGNSVYLVSERHHRLAAYDRLSGKAVWLPPIWAEQARRLGYMQKFNGAAEGLVVIDGEVWVALERNERGLVQFTDLTAEPRFHSLPMVAGLDFKGRSEDVAGLYFYDGGLYTLERNASAVCRRELPGLAAAWCIDYRSIEEDPANIYQDTVYGKGEGLAVTRDGIFVVLDNNNVARVADPEDRRGLLLHLAHPDPAVSRQSE